VAIFQDIHSRIRTKCNIIIQDSTGGGPNLSQQERINCLQAGPEMASLNMGSLMKKFEYEGAPLILAFVLGPMMEHNLRKSLIMSQGDFSLFFTRPLAAFFLIAALILLFSPLVPWMRKKREEIPKEEAS
jgi:hypothetical protein